ITTNIMKTLLQIVKSVLAGIGFMVFMFGFSILIIFMGIEEHF
ncbi:hypothetical protein LCGC14_2981470, partial [marine sediment metagenome]